MAPKIEINLPVALQKMMVYGVTLIGIKWSAMKTDERLFFPDDLNDGMLQKTWAKMKQNDPNLAKLRKYHVVPERYKFTPEDLDTIRQLKADQKMLLEFKEADEKVEGLGKSEPVELLKGEKFGEKFPEILKDKSKIAELGEKSENKKDAEADEKVEGLGKSEPVELLKGEKFGEKFPEILKDKSKIAELGEKLENKKDAEVDNEKAQLLKEMEATKALLAEALNVNTKLQEEIDGLKKKIDDDGKLVTLQMVNRKVNQLLEDVKIADSRIDHYGALIKKMHEMINPGK